MESELPPPRPHSSARPDRCTAAFNLCRSVLQLNLHSMCCDCHRLRFIAIRFSAEHAAVWIYFTWKLFYLMSICQRVPYSPNAHSGNTAWVGHIRLTQSSYRTVGRIHCLCYVCPGLIRLGGHAYLIIMFLQHCENTYLSCYNSPDICCIRCLGQNVTSTFSQHAFFFNNVKKNFTTFFYCLS